MGLVLIAEDEEAMLELFGNVVEDLGHRTMRAQNGDEALLLAHTERPDLVVSDHMMPRRTGIQLLRALRSDADFVSVPFVLVSAARPQGLEEADAFLSKPVDVNEFEAAVQKALGSRAAGAKVKEVRREAPERGPQTSEPPDIRRSAPRDLLHGDAEGADRLDPPAAGGKHEHARREAPAVEMPEQLVELVLGAPLAELADDVRDPMGGVTDH